MWAAARCEHAHCRDRTATWPYNARLFPMLAGNEPGRHICAVATIRPRGFGTTVAFVVPDRPKTRCLRGGGRSCRNAFRGNALIAASSISCARVLSMSLDSLAAGVPVAVVAPASRLRVIRPECASSHCSSKSPLATSTSRL